MDSRIYSKIGGDMSDFKFEEHMTKVGRNYPRTLVERAKKLMRVTPLSGRLTTAAALYAVVESGLLDSPLQPERFGHVLAGHNLNQQYFLDNMKELDTEPHIIDPLFGLLVFDTDVLAVISELVNAQGPSFTVGNACATGNVGILMGLDLIRSGRADCVLVSGGAGDFDPVMLQGFALMDALSCNSFNAEPSRASRPFDARREGFVPSHGAGALVLERSDFAEKRGGCRHAKILGAASCSDASRLPKPHIEGQVRALRLAMNDAGVQPEQIDYINAHAASTPLGDAVEVDAIKTVFQEQAHRIPINSTKSIIGHCLSASGTVELIATILQMEQGVIHPTINQEEPDPKLDLDFVPNKAREHQIKLAVSNAFGFGGFNSCVVVGKP